MLAIEENTHHAIQKLSRQVPLLERIAVALERIADALTHKQIEAGVAEGESGK